MYGKQRVGSLIGLLTLCAVGDTNKNEHSTTHVMCVNITVVEFKNFHLFKAAPPSKV